MGAGHAHALYLHEHSPIHRLPPEPKIVAAVVFVIAVTSTPRQALWAFAIYGLTLVAAFVIARVPFGFVLARLVAVLPFLLFAFLIPFVATGEQIEVLGVTVSRQGLWGAWNILAKAVIGATTSILLAATTEVPKLISGLTSLKVPAVLVAISAFMIRYLELIVEELGQMRSAMLARGYRPRWLGDVKPIAGAAGATFVRSYERGERAHAAMLSRGFTGTMPALARARPGTGDWVLAASLPLVGVAVAVTAVVMT